MVSTPLIFPREWSLSDGKQQYTGLKEFQTGKAKSGKDNVLRL